MTVPHTPSAAAVGSAPLSCGLRAASTADEQRGTVTGRTTGLCRSRGRCAAAAAKPANSSSIAIGADVIDNDPIMSENEPT